MDRQHNSQFPSKFLPSHTSSCYQKQQKSLLYLYALGDISAQDDHCFSKAGGSIKQNYMSLPLIPLLICFSFFKLNGIRLDIIMAVVLIS